MVGRIEDYALIGDTHTAALVGIDGSIDWLCLPRFDSGAAFAALLGRPDDHGRWLLAPAGGIQHVERAYREDTLVLETTFHTDTGVVRITDCMPIRRRNVDVVRVVEGVSGRVPMRMDLRIRFDYGSVLPWVVRRDRRLHATAGPNAVVFDAPVPETGVGDATVADFVVDAGERMPFVLTWHPSHEPPPRPTNALRAISETATWWRRWSKQCTFEGPLRAQVLRSLITLKALTYAPTGGIVAAPSTSLPEWIGSVRNWDYRFCWLRDSVLTLDALIVAGFDDEAAAWRDWLLRAVAGDPAKLQIMYGLAGERRLEEFTLDWLPGYEGSTPVRVGNAASGQFQLDVYGEVLGSLAVMRHALPSAATDESWPFEVAVLEFLEQAWHEPDDGLWESRGGRQHFTASKVAAWVAFDSAVRSAERFQLPGPVERWRAARDAIHAEVCAEGFDPELGSFTQSYGSRQLDASLLAIAVVGFLPADDPRVTGTVAAIERELLHDGFVLRYRTDHVDDGLPPGEGVFLACSFWLVDVYLLQGRIDEGRALFERLAGLANDVGLFSEEYDPASERQLGNFPQAFTHLAFVRAAANLARAQAKAKASG